MPTLLWSIHKKPAVRLLQMAARVAQGRYRKQDLRATSVCNALPQISNPQW
ncbi:hypothetical protein GS682_08790 [Nostoc sp. B(2019)]|nr:hypothetical protein [Nostoc sp. B(2019)]